MPCRLTSDSTSALAVLDTAHAAQLADRDATAADLRGDLQRLEQALEGERSAAAAARGAAGQDAAQAAGAAAAAAGKIAALEVCGMRAVPLLSMSDSGPNLVTSVCIVVVLARDIQCQ
jgi:predicted component of type VI protein secretion system